GPNRRLPTSRRSSPLSSRRRPPRHPTATATGPRSRPSRPGSAARPARLDRRRGPGIQSRQSDLDPPEESPLTRRCLLTSPALLAALTWLLAPPADAQRKGGTLRVAMIGEPPSLDPHMTTAVITREIGINWFETLFTSDAKYQPVPLLAESHEALDGAKRYVIRLRKGVRFHNGKELTAADVVASLKRWGADSTGGKATFKTVEAVEAKDAATVEIRLKEPAAGLPTILGALGSAAAIYPKEVIDAAGDGPIKDYIGT